MFVKPILEAREKLDSLASMTPEYVRSLALSAYDDPELADKLENQMLLQQQALKHK